MSNPPANRERYELRRFGPPTYKYTDLPAEHTAPTMHEAEEGQPPPPQPQQQRATDNLAPEYFKGLSTVNADLWMTSIENWDSTGK